MPTISSYLLTWWAYVLTFGALWGYATFGYAHKNVDGTTDTGMLFLWVAMALVGSTLIGLKNRRIRDGRTRFKANLGDGAAIVVALALVLLLPGWIGLVKGLALLALCGVYLLWYSKSVTTIQAASAG